MISSFVSEAGSPQHIGQQNTAVIGLEVPTVLRSEAQAVGIVMQTEAEIHSGIQ